MPMTVRELVAEPDLRLDLLVAGNLEARIRWVHSSEMPNPGRYLHGSEVVLSAGIWYWSGVEPADFVKSLVDARAAAVGFGTTPLHPTVPTDLVNACRAAGLTLFGIPVNVAFITIAEAYIARYVADHERPLRDAMRRNRQLLAAVAGGGGLPAILEVLTGHRPGPAFVVSRTRGLLASAGEPPTAARVAEVLTKVDAPRGLPADGSIRAIVGVGGAPAYLVVAPPDAAEGYESRALVDQTLPYLALELQRHVAARETERRIASELFDLVMAGPALLPAAASRLSTLGLDPATRMLAVVAGSADQEAPLDGLETALAREGLRGPVGVRGDEIWAVVGWSLPDADAIAVASRLRASLPEQGSLGVGRPVNGIDQLRASLVEARHACRFARQRRDGRYATYAEVGTHSLLLALQDEATLRAFHDAVLRPVVDYDRRRGTELLRTLQAFIESGGEFASTAAGLHIHVNTLRLRLSRVEALTGRSLASAEDRVDFFIALRAAG